MRFLLLCTAALVATVRIAYAKAVFAHFMVENVGWWEVDDWRSEIRLAKQAGVDAFAMNIRADDTTVATSIARAFSAAQDEGFKLFFSFDYAGGHAAHFRYKGRPLVSTFEGTERAADWTAIKYATNCYFVPDWSSAGAKVALELNPGVVDGLFNWAAWPWGSTDMNTYTDASYYEFLAQKDPNLTYMMAISPWFFTNLPGYEKNWIWRGDDLWYDRWQQALYLQPEFVQIISWNDYGESHYIGPLYSQAMGAFTTGRAPYNYVADMPHDPWRLTLPFVTNLYRNGKAAVEAEVLTTWYRLTPRSAGCSEGDTVGNAASHLQIEFNPRDMVQDKIFYTAVLAGPGKVTITVGGVDVGATWTDTPPGGIGLYHGSVAYGGNTGTVVVAVESGGVRTVVNGQPISTSCNRVSGQNGVMNWNAWVGGAQGRSANPPPEVDISGHVCVRGFGTGRYAEICDFTCGLGYCPMGACTCASMGPQRPLPGPDTPGYGTVGYPSPSADETFRGLCDFSCFYGNCFANVCSTFESPPVIPTISPFLPPTCTKGTGPGDLAGLCDYACHFGFCPYHACSCSAVGALIVPPPTTGGSGKEGAGKDWLQYGPICKFTCSRGYCPPGPCAPKGTPETGDLIVYVDPSVWTNPAGVTAACYPPCTLVMPPSKLPSPTTITFPPFTTSLEVGQSTGTTLVTKGGTVKTSTLLKVVTVTTVIHIPPVTTTEIRFWNVVIGQELSDEISTTLNLTSSILPPLLWITNSVTATVDAVSRTIHPPPHPWTSESGRQSRTVAWTSRAADPQCTRDCGPRCVGLYCNPGCIVCPRPNVDLPDPRDPSNPYPPNENPWSPEPEECTTTSASSCAVGCVAGLATPSCSTSCSLSYGCTATPTDGTSFHTLAPAGTVYDEFWPSETLGSAYTASVVRELRSELVAWFPSWTPPAGFYTATTHTPTPGTTTSPKTTSTAHVTVPLTRGGVNCFREADFPGHADIQSDEQETFSVDFSGLDDITIGPGDAPIRLRRTDRHGVNYDYRAEWVAGCITTEDRQSFRFPLGMSQSLITAYLLVREDYTKCNNGGVGGSCQAGCLLYTFEGGRGAAPCADIDCRWCGSPNDPAECQSCCPGFRLAVTQSQYPRGNHSHYVAGGQGGVVIDDLK